MTRPVSQDLRWAATSLLFHSELSGSLEEQLVTTLLGLSLSPRLREDINNVNIIINNNNMNKII